MMVSMIFMMLTRSVACRRRIVEVLDETPDINDDHCDTTARVKDGSIRFDHVYFKYDPNSPEVEPGGYQFGYRGWADDWYYRRHGQCKIDPGAIDPPPV